MLRALRGESSDGVEMMIRNPGHPDGLLISIDGRPLDASAGQVGAVAVFHDITELRRYETDLSVFAGVVAHDLKAPLARHQRPLRGGRRRAHRGAVVESGVARRRRRSGTSPAPSPGCAGLIDTLLAYTTSRDAPLHRRPRSTSARWSNDVIAGRTGHPRPGAGPLPDIYLGPLPDVDADPAMLRHVLDNLIGNALKYVPAGPARPGSTSRRRS